MKVRTSNLTFRTSLLDTVHSEEHFAPKAPDPAVSYIIDRKQSEWIKLVDLELCSRTCLDSLLNHLRLMQNLSVLNKKCQTDETCRFDEDYPFLSIPLGIDLKETELHINYKLSEYGSLFDQIVNGQCGLSEQLISMAVSRIIHCLHALHLRGFIHRAICSQHALITKTSSREDELDIILCGLGGLAPIPTTGTIGRNDIPMIDSTWRGWRRHPANSESNPTAHPVSWYSPEVLAQDFYGYSLPSDVYSLAMLIAELWNGQAPYDNLPPSKIMLQKITGANLPQLHHRGDEIPSDGMLEVYEACINSCPQKRPTTSDLLKMPWIRQGLARAFTPDALPIPSLHKLKI